MSLDGGLEEVEEFFCAAANWRPRRLFSSSSIPIRAIAADNFSSNVARRCSSDSLSEPDRFPQLHRQQDTNLTPSEQDQLAGFITP